MKNKLSDEIIDSIGILAKLELSECEKEKAKKDMEQMLDYIEQMNELDTTDVEVRSHVVSVFNVFREDVVKNQNKQRQMLKNAPRRESIYFGVPNTLEGK